MRAGMEYLEAKRRNAGDADGCCEACGERKSAQFFLGRPKYDFSFPLDTYKEEIVVLMQ
jgi:hypothetical protein